MGSSVADLPLTWLALLLAAIGLVVVVGFSQRSRLEACCDPNSIDELHRRAAAWYQGNGLIRTTAPEATIHLSQRELEVLRLIATGLSNHEIAAELVVAVSTVKTHVKSIYRKLNVGSRFEAIERVRELPLPPTSRRPA